MKKLKAFIGSFVAAGNGKNKNVFLTLQNRINNTIMAAAQAVQIMVYFAGSPRAGIDQKRLYFLSYLYGNFFREILNLLGSLLLNGKNVQQKTLLRPPSFPARSLVGFPRNGRAWVPAVFFEPLSSDRQVLNIFGNEGFCGLSQKFGNRSFSLNGKTFEILMKLVRQINHCSFHGFSLLL